MSPWSKAQVKEFIPVFWDSIVFVTPIAQDRKET